MKQTKMLILFDKWHFDKMVIRDTVASFGNGVAVEEADTVRKLTKILKSNVKKQVESVLFVSPMPENERVSLNAIKSVKKKFPDTKIILCGSGDLTNDFLSKSVEYGAKEILTKPFKIDEIKEMLIRHAIVNEGE